jgi:hypothetical protein
MMATRHQPESPAKEALAMPVDACPSLSIKHNGKSWLTCSTLSLATDLHQLVCIKPVLERFSSQNSVWLHLPFALKHSKASNALIILVYRPSHGKYSSRGRYAESDLLSIPNACRKWCDHRQSPVTSLVNCNDPAGRINKTADTTLEAQKKTPAL